MIWTISVRNALKLIVLGLAILCAACVNGQRKENVASNSFKDAEAPPSGQFIDIDGTRVHYQIEGSGSDLILIHGAGGNLRDFTFSITSKLAQDFRVIMFDRPGHGYTERLTSRANQGESPQEQAKLLSKAARALGVKDAILAGHSYGGAVALAWALQHPDDVRAVVMLAGVSNEWEGGLGTWYTVTTGFVGRNILIPVLSSLASRKRIEDTTAGIFAPNAVPNGYLDHVGVELSKNKTVLRATTQQVGGLKPHIIALEKQYGRLNIPVEILHGDMDDTVPLDVHGQVLAKQIKSANLVVLRGVGHMPHHIAQDQTINAIKRAAKRAGPR